MIEFVDNGGMGMKEQIVEIKENEFIKLKYIGEFNNGVLDESKADEFSDQLEEYLLSEANGITTLLIKTYPPEASMTEIIQDLLDKAEIKIKELAENMN